MSLLGLIAKIIRKRTRMKNRAKTGHSARRGNGMSSYQRQGKTPYRYSDAYYRWHKAAKAGRAGGLTLIDDTGSERQQDRRAA